MLTIVNNVIHVDLLVQEKRRVSFMYFCTHENINVFISTDRSSFPNNKISIFTVRPPHIKHIQFNESCLSYLDSYQTEADLEGARGVCAPPPLKFAKHMLYNVN